MHYYLAELNDRIDLPIIFREEITHTTGNLVDDTVVRLAEFPTFIGLAIGESYSRRLTGLRSLVGDDFLLFSQSEVNILDFLVEGGNGFMSITSNVAPGLCRAAYLAWRQDRRGHARRLNAVVCRLTNVLCKSPNPQSVKYALSLMNIMTPKMRARQLELDTRAKAAIFAALSEMCDKFPDYMTGRMEMHT